MPYGLVVDGQLRKLGDVKYLLSPQARFLGLQRACQAPSVDSEQRSGI